MASLNPLTREVVFKIVFYGPGLGGKTTTLQHIHAASKPEHRGKMVSLATPMDRTLYFDFLPLRMPLVHGMHVRLQLFTVPGQVYFGATRKLVLTGADGVVFVADSQTGRQDANQEALEDLVMNLAENNLALLSMPHTFHWNKRDIPDVVPIPELDKSLNRQGAPSLGTIATTGDGVFAGLEQITRLVFQAYEAELPKSSESIPVERSLQEDRPPIEEPTIADALRGLAEAPLRPRNMSGEPGPPTKASPSSNRAVAAPAPSSLESIPNPIPRRPTGSFEAHQTPPGGQVKPGPPSAPTPSPAPHTRTETPAPASVDRGGGPRSGSSPSIAVPIAAPPAPRSPSPPALHAVSQRPVEGVPPPPQRAPSSPSIAVPPQRPRAPSSPSFVTPMHEVDGIHAHTSHTISPRDRAAHRERDRPGTNPPPYPASSGHALSFAPLWPEADRESARQTEAALAVGDAAGALQVCDLLVTRLLASAAGLTGNAEAPRDPGLVVLLLGLDGRRYLAFRSAVRSARAHEPVGANDALEAYVFALEVRRALAAIGW